MIAGDAQSSVVFTGSLIQQDRDGYASSPEKGPSPSSSSGRHRGRSFGDSNEDMGVNFDERREAIRRQRIEAEQRRRDELRDGYARLKDVLPVSNLKSSKVSLLERGIIFLSSYPPHPSLICLQLATNHIVSSDPLSTTEYDFSPLAPLPSRIQRPPDKLHPTLSSWLKNINKLDSLINRLQELASSAPKDHRYQLLEKVAGLRATFKKQQERCIEFLQLSEDYANKYLLDLDAEIQQQKTLLDNLEERLEAANKLHKDAINLQTLYESRTVTSMDDLVTGKAVSRCP